MSSQANRAGVGSVAKCGVFVGSVGLALLAVGCTPPKLSKDVSQLKAPYVNGRFENLEPFPDKSFFQLLRWQITETRKAWPKWVEAPQYKVDLPRSRELRWSVVNHATVLIQLDGLNILTDPIYSERASPVSFAGPARVRNPGIAFDDLPPIDVVLVSHNHYEHLDLPTLQRLYKRDRPQILVGLGNGPLLESAGIERFVEVDWWDKFQVTSNSERNVDSPDSQMQGATKMEIHFVPAQHWSARGMFDRRRTLWGGFMIKGSRQVYFAGDTGFGSFFRLIQEKFGPTDLAFIPIGAYEPRWFMKPAHINPEEAVQAMKDLGAKKSVGMHFGTFQLTNEGIDDPVIALKESLKTHGIPSDLFIVPEFGRVVAE